MIIEEGQAVRLRVPAVTRWRPAAPSVILGIVGVGGGATGLSELLAASSSITTLGKVVFAVLGVVCLALAGWLLRHGSRMGRLASAMVPLLEATPESIRLVRANRKPRQVARASVASASFEVRPAEGDGTDLAYLEWFDEDQRSLAVWMLDPVVRAGLAAWLGAIDVELNDQ